MYRGPRDVRSLGDQPDGAGDVLLSGVAAQRGSLNAATQTTVGPFHCLRLAPHAALPVGDVCHPLPPPASQGPFPHHQVFFQTSDIISAFVLAHSVQPTISRSLASPVYSSINPRKCHNTTRTLVLIHLAPSPLHGKAPMCATHTHPRSATTSVVPMELVLPTVTHTALRSTTTTHGCQHDAAQAFCAAPLPSSLI